VNHTPMRPDRNPLANHVQGRRRVSWAWTLGLLVQFYSALAFAQHTSDPGQAPPPPPGPGQLTVQILADAPDAPVEGLAIALYALAPDGSPGLANGETDATGRFVFTGISNDPGIVYLVGARYGEIPFGERIAFTQGATDALVEIRVSNPTERVEGVRIEELRTRIDWMGDRIVVSEVVSLDSAGERVIQLPDRVDGPALFERPLPPDARDFDPGPSSIGDQLGLSDGRVRFFGPLYPGKQQVEYRWSLPLGPNDRTLRLPIQIGEPLERLVIVAGTPGLGISGQGLDKTLETTSEGAPALDTWLRDSLPAGERVELALRLPESRRDGGLLSIPRADLWLDLDDTRLDANVDLQLSVAPGAPVAGSPTAPLFHVVLPNGATLRGVAPEAEAMGLIPTADGGFDVIGPIGPGDHSLGYAYRISSRPEGLALDLRFPREVETLNVLIADTGLALDSRRLHRRRPFRNQTRNYLHREAYNVGPEEVIDLTLEPLRATDLSQNASIGLMLVAAVGAAFFLVTPLRSTASNHRTAPTEHDRLRSEREAVYTAIADLDHDFETGKLETVDYHAMRDELKTQAIELMRSEREAGGVAESAGEGAGGGVAESAGGGAVKPAPESPSPSPALEETIVATHAFCPSCGERVAPAWHFCSHCGGVLIPGEATGGTER